MEVSKTTTEIQYVHEMLFGTQIKDARWECEPPWMCSLYRRSVVHRIRREKSRYRAKAKPLQGRKASSSLPISSRHMTIFAHVSSRHVSHFHLIMAQVRRGSQQWIVMITRRYLAPDGHFAGGG